MPEENAKRPQTSGQLQMEPISIPVLVWIQDFMLRTVRQRQPRVLPSLL